MDWLIREEWQPQIEAVMEEHFGPAMTAFNMELPAMAEALGGSWGMTLWSCVRGA